MSGRAFWLGTIFGIVLACIAFIAIAAWSAILSPARAHSFYSAYCCDGDDCAPIRTDAVKAEPGGWRILLTGELWPYEKTQESPDGAFHWCEWPVGSRKTRCLYAPNMGF